ncbi:S-layer homology domain-containing protein [Peptoniphilus sp. MSJ-1]|uniref:S-layer homology domain-containing protein n=1 Tax=Peptoniphilus ovalis TaxID=2841503 RepID=A0ABS6FEK2_9FIRM|nr:S-layer homology domain-containing protein [Peptoniphilus ovalis]MBU5668602.1 S-layer homology domain-containing protein [Peptoniphilus ovalis]
MNKLKKLSLIFISSTLILTNSVFARSFRDLRGHWSESSVDFITERNIMAGYEDGSFRPNENMTRAQFYSVVNNLAGLDKTYTVTFSDVSTSDWFYNDVAKAIKAGYITPTTGRLNPNREITREEVAEILVYIYSIPQKPSAINEFSDSNSIKGSARGAVGALVDAGLLRGYSDGNFHPRRSIRRSEVATLFRSMITKYDYPQKKSLNSSKIKFGSRELYE